MPTKRNLIVLFVWMGSTLTTLVCAAFVDKWFLLGMVPVFLVLPWLPREVVLLLSSGGISALFEEKAKSCG